MQPIPLPTGIKGDSLTPKQQEFIVNAYLEKGDKPTISPRPGISKKGNIYGRCRGQWPFNGYVYRVASNKLFRLEMNKAGDIITTEIAGNITGSADCVMVASFTQLYIGVIGGDGFVMDIDENLEQITDVNYQSSRDCMFLDGRFVSVPFNGDPIQWSTVGDATTWPIENFSDAETLPDKNYQIIDYRGIALVGGGSTIEELVYDESRNIYVNTSGAAVNHGVVSDFARWGEQVVYIGKYENGTISIYMYGNELPISDKGVDEILSQYTAEQLRSTKVDAFVWRGQPMVTWRLPEETLIYYGDFAIIKTGVSNNFKGNWLGQYIASLQGRLICGDNKSDRIGELIEINSDYGEKVESIVRTFIRGTARDNFLITRIVAGVTTGQSNDTHEMVLTVSEDGVHGYNNDVEFADLGPVGVFNNEISWQQIGRFDNFCGIQMRWVTNIRVPVDGIYFE